MALGTASAMFGLVAVVQPWSGALAAGAAATAVIIEWRNPPSRRLICELDDWVEVGSAYEFRSAASRLAGRSTVQTSELLADGRSEVVLADVHTDANGDVRIVTGVPLRLEVLATA